MSEITLPDFETVSLTQGKVAMVDKCDFEFVRQFNWSANKLGRTWYAMRREGSRSNSRILLMHREILMAASGFFVDHINHDGLDNRRTNIRLCSRTENQCNQQKQDRETSSIFKGVSWSKVAKKWEARFGYRGRSKYLGLFLDEREAAVAYDTAVKKVDAFFLTNRELGLL